MYSTVKEFLPKCLLLYLPYIIMPLGLSNQGYFAFDSVLSNLCALGQHTVLGQ